MNQVKANLTPHRVYAILITYCILIWTPATGVITWNRSSCSSWLEGWFCRCCLDGIRTVLRRGFLTSRPSPFSSSWTAAGQRRHWRLRRREICWVSRRLRRLRPWHRQRHQTNLLYRMTLHCSCFEVVLRLCNWKIENKRGYYLHPYYIIEILAFLSMPT